MVNKNNQELGLKIQALRRRCGLSIRHLARTAGVTAGMISFIERGKTSPSIALLRKVLEAMGTNIQTFFGSGPATRDGPVYRREGMRLVMDPERRYTLIFPRQEGLDIQMLDEQFVPSTRKPPMEKLKCAVAGYVISGTLVLELKGRPPRTLRPGDAFYIPAGIVHRGYAGKHEPVRQVTVYSPATY